MKNVLIIAAILAVIAIAYYADQTKRVKPEVIRLIDSLHRAKDHALLIDSVSNAATKHILDSIYPILKGYEKRLNLVEYENDRQRKANEVRFRAYDSIVLDRPDF